MESEKEPLPQELVVAILNCLSARALAVAACVCRSWRSAALALNRTPRFFSALSMLPRLEDAVDAVLEDILTTAFRPEFAMIFAAPQFRLSDISALVKTRLPVDIPLIACCSAGITGRDIATGEHIEKMFFDDAEYDEQVGQLPGLVMTVGCFPGLHVKSLKLQNAYSVAEVERFVAAAGTAYCEGHDAEAPLLILLFGDPRVQASVVLEPLDRAYGGKSAIVGGLANFALDIHEECLLVHSAVNTHYLEESNSPVGGKEPARRRSLRLAGKEPTKAETPCEFVALVFTQGKGSSSSDSSRVQCQVSATGGLKAVGPVYQVVSVRGIKDSLTKEVSTEISCERGGVLMDGHGVLQDISNEINHVGIPPTHIGVFRKLKRPNQLPHFSLHELLESHYGYLCISGGGVRTRDSFRFYQPDPLAARQSVHDTLSSLTSSLHGFNLTDDNQARVVDHSLLSASSARKQAIGGLFFGCCGRGERFFGEPNVESSIFQQILPWISMAGFYCLSEFGPPAILPGVGNDSEVMKGKAIENFFSSMFLFFYT